MPYAKLQDFSDFCHGKEDFKGFNMYGIGSHLGNETDTFVYNILVSHVNTPHFQCAQL